MMLRLRGGMPPLARESSTGVTRQDSLPPTESQEAAEAFDNMALSDEEEERDWQCSFIKANGEQCQRANDGIWTGEGCFCWQHPTRVIARARTA
jgi:hypothetical protein